ncbi:MAG: PAS domain S-box protein, partial [Pseudomonadota bacterium]|nr:PAS domain S-box protein [Pseudomonadota bacterium]
MAFDVKPLGPESSLVASEALYRATFDQAALGIAHVALDGRWLRVNDRLCAITGYSREELLGRRYDEITHPDDVAGNIAQVKFLHDGGAPRIVLEKRYIRRDGGIVWVKVTASMLRDADGRPLHLISTLDDISDRKRAETEARDNERRLRQALDGLPEMAWMTRSDGYAVYYNRRFAEYAGYELGPGFDARMALVHPEDAERVRATSARARAGEIPFAVESRLRRHDGAWRWHRMHAVVLDAPDAAAGDILSVATAVDIHDMREAERALAEANADLEY